MNVYLPDIDIGGGYTFRAILQGNKVPEIYGWVEKDHSMVAGTSGWYRTADAQVAADYAKGNLPG